MNLEAFFANYPQFTPDQVDPTIVQAKLNEAAARMGGPDGRVWGSFSTTPTLNLADYAHGSLAAYLLSIAPTGQATRTDGKAVEDDKNPYLQQYRQFQEMVGGGFIVAGGSGPIRRGWPGP